MQILSSTEAISPAIARTRLVLFTPFRVGRSWKLAATGYLSFAGTVFFPFSLMYLLAVPILSRTLGHFFVIAVVTGSLALTAIYAIVFYLCSRLQFAFFDIVLNRGEFVAPAWRKYGAVSSPWTWIKFAIGLLLTLLLAIPAVPLLRVFTAAAMNLPASMKSMQPGQSPPPEFFNLMAGFYGAYFSLLLVMGLYYLVMSTLSSFLVPSMALEGLAPLAALRRFITFVQRETGAFFGFVGLRILMGVAGYFALALAIEVVLLVLALVVGLICLLIGLLLHAVGVPSPVLMGLAIFAGIVFFVLVYGYLIFFAMGAFFTFFEAHTLYFLGGRYALLGDLLERSTPPPVYTTYPQGSYATPAGSPPSPTPAPAIDRPSLVPPPEFPPEN